METRKEGGQVGKQPRQEGMKTRNEGGPEGKQSGQEGERRLLPTPEGVPATGLDARPANLG